MTTQAQRFQKPDVLRMFPTYVWRARLLPAVSGPLNETILQSLSEIGAPLAGLKPGEG